MKRLYSEEKYIRHSIRVAKKALKKRLRRNAFIKAERRTSQGKTRVEIQRNRDYSNFTHVEAPEDFSFLNNPEGIISFISVLEQLLEKNKRVFVVLKKVKTVDYGAITVLLSVMIKFRERMLGFNGDLPKDVFAMRLIVESGFFEQLQKSYANRSVYKIGKENQILTHAQKNVSSELGLPIMEAASNTIWGKKMVCKGLQRTLVELMQNTNNHAARGRKGGKHWWLSVNHDSENKKVGFVFMDHGIGIFSSLNNKSTDSKWYGWKEKAKKVCSGKETDEEILKLLLNGEIHRTVTGQNFRGKGLPSIKEVLDRNQISNLYIITNNVYANVAKGEYRLLNKVFKGTFFYWELCKNNSKQPWIK